NCGDRSDSEIRELLDAKAFNYGCQLRSILKRKDTGIGFKPRKRVRFDCAYKNDLQEQFEKCEDPPADTFLMNSKDSNGVSLPADAGALPDYL
ncbi:hypothetical protein OV907_25400, partial [Salmonella enterica subsp. enterica serovar 1,4,[5],12:i:-]|nr:hypothetical protein [Salmonella enterica subsp. enterica serovar 1,4,[5],12:i:-]